MKDDHDIPIDPKDDHVALLYPSLYLKKEDLRGKDVELTISRVTLRDVRTTGDGTVRKVEEMDKRQPDQRKVWIVPKTVAVDLAERYAEKAPSKWKGRKVTLYNDESVMAFGKRVGGIRVRSAK
jgi:hypothetical protein